MCELMVLLCVVCRGWLVSAKLAVYSDNEDNDDDNDPVMVT